MQPVFYSRAALAFLAACLATSLLGAARLAAPPSPGSAGQAAALDLSDDEFKDLLVTNQEASGSLMHGVGGNSDSGLTGSIVLNERNFEGLLIRVASVSFTGNTFLHSAVLANRISTLPTVRGIGSTYNYGSLENDGNELTKLYRSYGFHDVKVTHEQRFLHDGRSVDVIFHVTEGVRYRLADAPKVVGVKCMPAEALEAIIKLKAGDVYKQADVDADVERIKAYLGYQGRDARVQATPVFDRETPGAVHVRYDVTEQVVRSGGQIIIPPDLGRLQTSPAGVGASFAQTLKMLSVSPDVWKCW
jgi:outer membrane protein assembly factor BamA